jgi:hypothetical protein
MSKDDVTAAAHGASPIAFGDAEKPVAYMIVGKGARWLQWAPRVADDDAGLVTVVPLFASLHREAIAEKPSSFEGIGNDVFQDGLYGHDEKGQ